MPPPMDTHLFLLLHTFVLHFFNCSNKFTWRVSWRFSPIKTPVILRVHLFCSHFTPFINLAGEAIKQLHTHTHMHTFDICPRLTSRTKTILMSISLIWMKLKWWILHWNCNSHRISQRAEGNDCSTDWAYAAKLGKVTFARMRFWCWVHLST